MFNTIKPNLENLYGSSTWQMLASDLYHIFKPVNDSKRNSIYIDKNIIYYNTDTIKLGYNLARLLEDYDLFFIIDNKTNELIYQSDIKSFDSDPKSESCNELKHILGCKDSLNHLPYIIESLNYCKNCASNFKSRGLAKATIAPKQMNLCVDYNNGLFEHWRLQCRNDINLPDDYIEISFKNLTNDEVIFQQLFAKNKLVPQRQRNARVKELMQHNLKHSNYILEQWDTYCRILVPSQSQRQTINRLLREGLKLNGYKSAARDYKIPS